MHCTLKEQGTDPYHVQKMQALEPADFPRRVIDCELLLQQCRERPSFLNCILFTYKAGFPRNVVINTHIWSDENPYAGQEVRFQQRLSKNVWAGIVNDRLVGPCVLLNKLNVAQYLE